MGGVYYDEYVVYVFVDFVDQLVFGVVEVQYGGCVVVNVYFVFEVVVDYVVVFIQVVVGVGDEFGYEEQVDVFGVFGVIFEVCQYEVYDVFGYVVFIGGDEDFGVGYVVGVVVVVVCFGVDDVQVGVGVWFGQVYGVGLVVVYDVWQVEFFQFVVVYGVQGCVGVV